MSISAWFFYILAIIFTLTGVLSYLFELEPITIMLEMTGTGFIFYLVPHVGEWCADHISSFQIIIHKICA